MPEHQEQQATVAGFVPAALGRLDQPFDLAPGEVLSVAVPVPTLTSESKVRNSVDVMVRCSSAPVSLFS